MTLQPYSQLIALKRWADRGLYEVVSQNLERLSQEEASIMLRIFDHIHTVDRIFQHHLQGIPHPFKAPRSERVPEFERPVDFVFTSGKAARMTSIATPQMTGMVDVSR